MMSRIDVMEAEEKRTLLWFLETEPGGTPKAVSAFPSAVTETGVYFQSIYRSFGGSLPHERSRLSADCLVNQLPLWRMAPFDSSESEGAISLSHATMSPIWKCFCLGWWRYW